MHNCVGVFGVQHLHRPYRSNIGGPDPCDPCSVDAYDMSNYISITINISNYSIYNIGSACQATPMPFDCLNLVSVTNTLLAQQKSRSRLLLSFCTPIPCRPMTSLSRSLPFYRASAVAASPVLATIEMSVRPSVCPSVRLSVRHTLTLCENDAS